MPRKPRNSPNPNGVRLTKRQADSTREKIRATLIAQRLEAFLLSEKVAFAGTKRPRKVVLTKDQIKAAEILLAKSLPDLARTEHTGADGGPIATRDDTPGLGGVKAALAKMMTRTGERTAQDE